MPKKEKCTNDGACPRGSEPVSPIEDFNVVILTLKMVGFLRGTPSLQMKRKRGHHSFCLQHHSKRCSVAGCESKKQSLAVIDENLVAKLEVKLNRVITRCDIGEGLKRYFCHAHSANMLQMAVEPVLNDPPDSPLYQRGMAKLEELGIIASAAVPVGHLVAGGMATAAVGGMNVGAPDGGGGGSAIATSAARGRQCQFCLFSTWSREGMVSRNVCAGCVNKPGAQEQILADRQQSSATRSATMAGGGGGGASTPQTFAGVPPAPETLLERAAGRTTPPPPIPVRGTFSGHAAGGGGGATAAHTRGAPPAIYFCPDPTQPNCHYMERIPGQRCRGCALPMVTTTPPSTASSDSDSESGSDSEDNFVAIGPGTRFYEQTKPIRDAATIRNLEAENERLRQQAESGSTVCVVCLTNAKDIAIVPCGHKCVCETCVAILMQRGDNRCPVCRGQITATITVYDV